MSFVIIGGERYALELGDTVLGGADDTLRSEAMSQLPAVAVISFPLDGPTTVRSLDALPVTLNGALLHGNPHVLQHGDRLQVNAVVIAYGDMRKAGRTAHLSGSTEESVAALLQSSGVTSTASTGGRLTRLGDKAVFSVPEHGLALGRDPSSDVVLASKGASRAHATIAPGLLGYTLTDHSANGLWVNGERLMGKLVLGQGDVLRMGHEEFRFDADEASFEPDRVDADDESDDVVIGAAGPDRTRPPRLLATLEVLSDGPLKGERFRIDRASTQLGRGPRNDVRLSNESVSTSHATLVRTGNHWMILDLDSRNGTFVDGGIVRGQQRLPGVCELALGTLTLLFRVINAGETAKNSTIGVIGLRSE